MRAKIASITSEAELSDDIKTYFAAAFCRGDDDANDYLDALEEQYKDNVTHGAGNMLYYAWR